MRRIEGAYREGFASGIASVFRLGQRSGPPLPMVRREYGSLQGDGDAVRRDAMRSLAALSFDPDSLERGLEDEINRNAWHNPA